MNALPLLPTLPAALSILTAFGALLLTGIVGARLFARPLAIPDLTAWVLAGMLIGLPGLKLIAPEILTGLKLVTDLALALVLFQLGRRLDLVWLLRERWLLLSTLLCAAAMFGTIALVLQLAGLPTNTALFAAALALPTAPTTVLLIVRESRAEGAVTDRTLNMTALGNVLAWLVFGLLYTWAYAGQTDWLALAWPIGRFVVALPLGFAGGWLAVRFARWLGRGDGNQPVMLVSLILLLLGGALALGCPVAVVLLGFGAASRHYDRDFSLDEPNLLPFGRLLYIALFVHTGAMLSLDTFAIAWLPTLLLLAARTASLTAMTTLLAPKNGLSWRQGACTGLALSPIAWATLVWVGEIGQIEPAAAAPLAAIALAVQTVSALLGPIVTRFALQRCGESARYMGVSLPN